VPARHHSGHRGKRRGAGPQRGHFRLARIYFQKDQPDNARYAVERISGAVPPEIRDDLDFLRARFLMANGRFTDAARAF